MTELKTYLSYADEIENTNPIMAAYCRLHYVDSYIKQLKQEQKNLTKEDKEQIKGILENVEKVKSVSKLSKEEKKEEVSEYCMNMYTKIMKSINDQKSDNLEYTDMLTTIRNFIQILTSFGPLSSDWVKKGNTLYTL